MSAKRFRANNTVARKKAPTSPDTAPLDGTCWFDALPDELMITILSLSMDRTAVVRLVCRRWFQISSDHQVMVAVMGEWPCNQILPVPALFSFFEPDQVHAQYQRMLELADNSTVSSAITFALTEGEHAVFRSDWDRGLLCNLGRSFNSAWHYRKHPRAHFSAMLEYICANVRPEPVMTNIYTSPLPWRAKDRLADACVLEHAKRHIFGLGRENILALGRVSNRLSLEQLPSVMISCIARHCANSDDEMEVIALVEPFLQRHMIPRTHYHRIATNLLHHAYFGVRQKLVYLVREYGFMNADEIATASPGDTRGRSATFRAELLASYAEWQMKNA